MTPQERESFLQDIESMPPETAAGALAMANPALSALTLASIAYSICIAASFKGKGYRARQVWYSGVMAALPRHLD